MGAALRVQTLLVGAMSDVATPELDKMLAAIAPRKVNDVLTEFVDWLESEKIVLARYGATKERTVRCDACDGTGFDSGPLTARQRQLLRRGALRDEDRPRCDCSDGKRWESYIDPNSLVEIHESYERLFSRFLGIDQDAIERERRAILEALRA